MNQKQLQYLKHLANEAYRAKGIPEVWAYKELKKLWKSTPKDKLKHVFD